MQSIGSLGQSTDSLGYSTGSLGQPIVRIVESRAD